MTTLDDFYGDGSADPTPECSFCGGQDDAKKGAPITPTWDEAIDTIQQAKGGSICYACRAEIIGSVIEDPVSPVEFHFLCEGCWIEAQNKNLLPEAADYIAAQYQTIY